MRIKIAKLMLAVMVILSFTAAYALENGTYSVTNSTSYVNPDTGKTEDGGTDLSIGEPMARSLAQKIMLYEVDGDNQYVTIRIGLSSYTKDMRISILDTENKDSGYQPVPFDIVKTNKETDTTEYKFEVDSLNIRIRVTFYVGPMSRDVIFFITPDASTAVADNGAFAESDKVQSGYGAAFSGGNAEEGKMPAIVKDLTGVSEVDTDNQPDSETAEIPDTSEKENQLNETAGEEDEAEIKESKAEVDDIADTKDVEESDINTGTKTDENVNTDNNEANDSGESIETAVINESATNNEDSAENKKADEETGLTQFDSQGNQVAQPETTEVSENSYTVPIVIGALVLVGVIYFVFKNNNQKKKRDSVK